MFRNNLLCDFRNDFNYLKISKEDRKTAQEAIGLSGAKPEILEGTDNLYIGFYRSSDMEQMKNLLEVLGVKSELYKKAESFQDSSVLTGLMD